MFPSASRYFAVPIMVQASFDTNNGQQLLTGSDASALVATFLPYDEVACLGVNCAFGPYDLAESTRYIAENWPRLVSAIASILPAAISSIAARMFGSAALAS